MRQLVYFLLEALYSSNLGKHSFFLLSFVVHLSFRPLGGCAPYLLFWMLSTCEFSPGSSSLHFSMLTFIPKVNENHTTVSLNPICKLNNQPFLLTIIQKSSRNLNIVQNCLINIFTRRYSSHLRNHTSKLNFCFFCPKTFLLSTFTSQFKQLNDFSFQTYTFSVTFEAKKNLEINLDYSFWLILSIYEI